jgi:hypothetical protein
MIEPKDSQLVSELLKATQAGKIPWSPTAKRGEFVASFRGKFSVLVSECLRDQPPGPDESAYCYGVSIVDEFGAALHKFEDRSIEPLVDAVRRVALHSEEAIDEILQDLRTRQAG